MFAVVTGLLVIGSLTTMGLAIAQHGDAGLFERLATVVGRPLGHRQLKGVVRSTLA